MQDDPLYEDDLFDHQEASNDTGDADGVDEAPFSRADQWVDELMPDGFDWRHVVTTYPRTSMVAVALGGVVIGRAHGAGLLAGLSGFFIGEVTRNLKDVVEDLTGG